MNTQTTSHSNTAGVSAITELFIVFVLIIFASVALPDGFVKFMINEFGSIGSFFMTMAFYLAVRVTLMIRLQKYRGVKK